ncbi:unnamed protein product [Paramecium sonneborni]|uniref:Uncharacterized protein n=1 Tax=Paramecium sonneborni TaxID=65129 RepID=A0A8S1RMB7_9CILI|nr:unnamed protein product [Paramecium sonneborni]
MTENTANQYRRRTYVKVSPIQKTQLINLVFQEQWKIKKAAKFLYVKYASAKSIVLKYRKYSIQKKMPTLPEIKRCHYKPLRNGKHNYKIICLRGGIFQNTIKNFSLKQ